MKKLVRSKNRIVSSQYEWYNERKTSSGKYSTRAEAKMPSGQRYRVYVGNPDVADFVQIGFEIDRISPYDDAPYFWASMGNDGVIKFIQSGHVVDKMYFGKYSDDEYENRTEYLTVAIENALDVLEQMNSDIQPRIIHN